jgi:hypothetical protein
MTTGGRRQGGVNDAVMPRVAQCRPASRGTSFLGDLIYGLVLDGVAGGVRIWPRCRSPEPTGLTARQSPEEGRGPRSFRRDALAHIVRPVRPRDCRVADGMKSCFRLARPDRVCRSDQHRTRRLWPGCDDDADYGPHSWLSPVLDEVTVRRPLVWAIGQGVDVAADPLPVVLFSNTCAWRTAVVETLGRAGRAWRVAFESNSLVGVLAALRAGLGVAAVMRPTSNRSWPPTTRTSCQPCRMSSSVSRGTHGPKETH